MRNEDPEEKEPIFPNYKNEILLSKNNFGNQITNRTMTEFSRSKQLDQIDE